MPIVLARIDDRLIHGQVAHGWSALRATLFVVVSDTLRADPSLADLYLVAVPDGARGRVLSVAETLAPSFREEAERERTILVLPGTEEALRLVEGGLPLVELNVGGLHFSEGKRELLPYLFWDDADLERLRSLAARGVKLTAQDLPSNPAHALEPHLAERP